MDEVNRIYQEILAAYCLPAHLQYRCDRFVDYDELKARAELEGVEFISYHRHPVHKSKITLIFTTIILKCRKLPVLVKY